MTKAAKPAHGGQRTGAGRPPGALNQRTVASNAAAATLPLCDDPKAFLEAVMGNAEMDARLRIDAAKSLMQYVHIKADTAKKPQAQEAAKKAASGRFGPSPPPVRLVN
jgi:hypothetical protein